ncbi:hypothetical protein P7C70_g7451, partial [Phenoliferia sp. Uapishka_3]
MTAPSPLIFGRLAPRILTLFPRKVTQDVDFAPHLKSIITRQYSESADAYIDELALLNRSRQDALRGSAGSDVTGRDLLYKYFGQLELLELRFPELRVPFPWLVPPYSYSPDDAWFLPLISPTPPRNDAFTHVKISQLSLAYEKASVIFNIGATLSSLAAASPRTSPEGLKRAFLSFRCASGMFTYINDNFLHAPSTDLSREVVKVLVGLMGAQATEVFIETMPAGAKSAGLKSKLCMQASGLYGGIVEEVKEWLNKGVFIREWSFLIQTKAKYFASLAQYYRSLSDSAASKYGEALARLGISENLAKEASRFANLFQANFSTSSSATSLAPDAPVSLTELIKTHLGLVSEARTKAQKDNDLVYNDVVPSEASLPVIEKGKEVAEPIAIHDVYATPDVQKIVGPDLFARLVPLSVHESASMYSEEKAKLVRAEVERADLADGELVAALEYMGLPASLDRFRSGAAGQDGLTDPGAEVRSWADKIRRDESQERVEDMLAKLANLRGRATKDLDSTKSNLEVEARECELMRVRYAHLWEQSPSASLTRSFRQDLKSHSESLEQAAASDAQAQKLWDEVRREVECMKDPSGSALERVFVEAVGTGSAAAPNLLDSDFGEDEDADIKKRVASISDALSKLNKVKKERLDLLKDLKERVQGDDISHLLILNRKGSAAVEPTLFATELEKFRAHQTRIASTIHHQQATLTEISNDFRALSESKKAREMQGQWGDAERKKKDVVARLHRAKDAYSEVRNGVSRGLQFYQDLSELIDGLCQQVTSFLSSRDAERNQLASSAAVKQRLEGPRSPSFTSGPPSSLDRGMGSMNLGPRSPPLPPPPPPQQQQSWAQPPSAYNHTSTPPQPPSSYAPPASSYSPSPLPSPYSPAPSPSPYSSAPPPPRSVASPYQNLPTSGPFSMAPPPPSHSYSSSPAPPPSQPYGALPPRQLPQQQQYSQPPTLQQHYSQPPARQASFPPPPQPAGQSFLPPPPAPVSYSSYSS